MVLYSTIVTSTKISTTATSSVVAAFTNFASENQQVIVTNTSIVSTEQDYFKQFNSWANYIESCFYFCTSLPNSTVNY